MRRKSSAAQGGPVAGAHSKPHVAGTASARAPRRRHAPGAHGAEPLPVRFTSRATPVRAATTNTAPAVHSGVRDPEPPQLQLGTRGADAGAAAGVTPGAARPRSQDEASGAPQQQPDLVPVMVCRTLELPAQATLGQAAAELLGALGRLPRTYAGLRSGCVRLEVPLPASCTALAWLAGQMQQAPQPDAPPPSTLQARARRLSLYFSGRHSSAPDTPLATQAEQCTQGWAAVASYGAAWHWQGQARGGVGNTVVQQMQRFLAADQPHVRILGGTRFDATSEPSPDWQTFGAYLFVLPLLEFTERGSGCVLATTVAWDSTVPPSTPSPPFATPAWGHGACSLGEAVEAARAAVAALRAPQRPPAGTPRLAQREMQHTPTREEWDGVMARLLDDLGGAPPRQAGQGGAANGGAVALGAAAAFTSLGPAGQQQQQQGLPLDMSLAREEYLTRGQQGLDDLLAAVGGAAARPSQLLAPAGTADALDGAAPMVLDPDQGGGQALTKVVLARRTRLVCSGAVDPLWLLEALQERDPRAYQLFVSDGHGTSFLACTPERLYARTGRMVASEAVAATRARGPPGDVERDFWLSIELLNSDKDHREFTLVRDWIRDALASCSERVDVEVPKSVLKQGALQHLYGRLAARLRPGVNDAHILQALHPTPAVCGRPRDDASQWLRAHETFDRGFYAGPFGWVSGQGAEFAVAIRSSLVSSSPATPLLSATSGDATTTVHMYAGVGIVPGSEPLREWQELDLKIRQFAQLLQPRPGPAELPNVNAAWATLLVEELCRQGVNLFCVAPGSRSSPLALAVASHPRARLNVCVDERSLGFWALGFGRAARRPAVVVTSSGTAVANLLPACVEASQSEVPLLLLTADRPAELRDTGANQTIDQVKIFGGYTRWFQDVPAPGEAVPGRLALSTVATALRHCLGGAGAGSGAPAGPVHLNLQFREPLAPVAAPWQSSALMEGLTAWDARPWQVHTSNAGGQAGLQLAPAGALPLALQLGVEDVALQRALACVWSARRGLLVLGEVQDPAEVAAALQLSRLLGWPTATDVLSGLRTASGAGAAGSALEAQEGGEEEEEEEGACLLHFMDHVLLGDQQWWAELAPDVVLQVGPRVTSKRLNQFMEWAAGSQGAAWLYVGTSAARHDATHAVQAHVGVSVRALTACLAAARPPAPPPQHTNGAAAAPHQHRASQQQQEAPAERASYRQLLRGLNQVAQDEVAHALGVLPVLSEPGVARTVSQLLPHGHALFLGNSMPIRDMDMYAQPRTHDAPPAQLGSSSSVAQQQRQQRQRARRGDGAPLRTAANRGASGIDGVLSTAAGFAEGLARPTTLVVGDLSFLHDSNGLNMLRGGEARAPLTVVLVNNNGGGIFSFLPIARAVAAEQFEPLWGTPQNADFSNLCRAHGLPYQRVTALPALGAALDAAWGLNRHSVIEVVTERSSNVRWHRWVQRRVARAVQAHHHAAAQAQAGAEEGGGPHLEVVGVAWRRFALPLTRALTTTATSAAPPSPNSQLPQPPLQQQQQARHGLLVELTFADAGGRRYRGHGEVAPLPSLHAESLDQCEAQLQLAADALRGVRLPLHARLLGGRLRAALLERSALCGLAADLAPSVRAGLEAAALDGLAQRYSDSGGGKGAGGGGGSLLAPHQLSRAPVHVCGLVSEADEGAAVERAVRLVGAPGGPGALKIKVARSTSTPAQDAARVLAIRCAVGPHVELRADANRGWDLQQAVQFGRLAAGAALSFVEEPVHDPSDLPAFFQATGVPYALDESLDAADPLAVLEEHLGSEGLSGGAGAGPGGTIAAAGALGGAPSSPPRRGLAAVVLKPSVLGGPEATLGLAGTAVLHGLQVIISSSFEGPVGLAGLVELASAVDQLTSDAELALPPPAWRAPGQASPPVVVAHHGLGTVGWFAEASLPAGCAQLLGAGSVPVDQVLALGATRRAWADQLGVAALPLAGGGVSLQGAQRWSCVARVPREGAQEGAAAAAEVRLHGLTIEAAGAARRGARPHVVFLHGFLGSKEDWVPHMRALATLGWSCTAVDLPGHGESAQPADVGVEQVAAALASVLRERGLAGCALVGYSMGARVAMSTAVHHPDVVGSLACVSGTPGIKDARQARRRAEADAQLARVLEERGLDFFLRMWYSQPLWSTLRQLPSFPALLQRRLDATRGHEAALAASLTWASTGRMESMWAALHTATTPLLLVTGQADEKFGVISGHIQKVARASRSVTSVSVPGAGHAVQEERPWAVVAALAQWLPTVST